MKRKAITRLFAASLMSMLAACGFAFLALDNESLQTAIDPLSSPIAGTALPEIPTIQEYKPSFKLHDRARAIRI